MELKQAEIRNARATISVSSKVPDLDKFKEQAKKYNWRLLIDGVEWKQE
jgi:hypothetical protein